MFGSMKTGASAYAKVGMETGVLSASPHQLIIMLFDGANVFIQNAIKEMATGHIEKRGKEISKAVNIINEGLRASLDKRAGGELAQSLDSLYLYMVQRLMEANLQSSVEPLMEVQALLKDIRSAWAAIGIPSASLNTDPRMPLMTAA
jgi:flagellar protein FliS